MKKPTLAVWAVVLAFAIWGNLAYADSIVADIQFPFKADGKDFAAGQYHFDTNLQSSQITLRSESTGKGVLLAIVSRLSDRGQEALVVFDKVGDQYYLSEIYMPGLDGFEIKGTSGQHTHLKVKAGK